MPDPATPFFITRAPLANTAHAMQSGRLTVGFIGGSITDPRPRYSWPEAVLASMADRWPALRIRVENAAIGGTNSQLACFRARRDLIDRKCDLVFVEFAVNDLSEPPEVRALAREGLLRQILATGATDVVLVHVFARAMLPEMLEGKLHPSVSDFEEIAEHYRLNTVFAGRHALDEVRRGLLRPADWLPDGIHPQARGSLSYAEPVFQFLTQALDGGVASKPERSPLPPPLQPDRWEHFHLCPFEDFQLTGPWLERRWAHHTGFDVALDTSSPDASFRATMRGHTLVLGWDEGLDAGEFAWRIDGGPWQTYDRKPGAWLPETSLYRSVILAQGLPETGHQVEVRNGLWAREGKLTSRFSVAFLAGVTRDPVG